MSVYANWITGVCVGFEFYEDDVEIGFILDLFIIRFVFLRNS